MTRYHRQFTFCLLLGMAGSAAAGVLPEDRADVMYHYYDGGGVQIDGPSVLARKKVLQNFSLFGNYYVDTVSSASIDVVTTASPYDEERTEMTAGVDYLSVMKQNIGALRPVFGK